MLDPLEKSGDITGGLMAGQSTVPGEPMDPRQLFSDERSRNMCVYCGTWPDTRDHAPPRIFLDEPLPDSLPVVESCYACNNALSSDEQYLACFIECVKVGSTEPEQILRPKVRATLKARPQLTRKICESRRVESSGEIIWTPELDRVRNVVVKLARAHMAYELSDPQFHDPETCSFVPLHILSDDVRDAFENGSRSDNYAVGWPEIGSRAYIRAAKAWCTFSQPQQPDINPWLVVQPGRYRYRVDDRTVRFVISEYLACEVTWL